MLAARVTELTGADGIAVVEIDVPEIAADEVLIEVRSVGLSAADLLMASGRYQQVPETPFTLGMDLAGVVAAVGDGVTRFSVGDRVAATMPHGAAAEYAVSAEATTLPLPDATSFAEGAALPVNYLTADFALTTRGGLRAGEVVLVHGAAGGLGGAAVQIAKALGARVIAVVGSERKAEIARRSGADDVVLQQGFAAAARALTDGRGVDVVVDPVGAAVFDDSLRCLAFGGRHLVLGFAGGGAPPELRVHRLLLRNADVRGVSWGGHSEAGAAGVAAQWDALCGMLERGELRPLIGARFPLREMREALAELAGRESVGKIVVDVR